MKPREGKHWWVRVVTHPDGAVDVDVTGEALCISEIDTSLRNRYTSEEALPLYIRARLYLLQNEENGAVVEEVGYKVNDSVYWVSVTEENTETSSPRRDDEP